MTTGDVTLPDDVQDLLRDADGKNLAILSMRSRGKTYDEIERALHVSRERVSRVVRAARDVLPSPLRSRVRRRGARDPVEGAGRQAALRVARRTRMAELAAAGYTSNQIADELGYSSGDTVRWSARKWGIEINADRTVAGRRHHDVDRMTEELVNTLDGLTTLASLIRVDQADMSKANGWLDAIDAAMLTLAEFRKQLALALWAGRTEATWVTRRAKGE